MGNYKLIALDMDGTLLNSEKEITARTKEAIRRAAEAGKTVVLSTGRGMAELSEYLEQVPEIRFLDCASGAMIYDCREKKVIVRHSIGRNDLEKILRVARERDLMVHFLSTESVVEQRKYDRIEEYQMGVYRPLFACAARKCADIYQFFEKDGGPVEKCNLYHRSPEDRNVTEQELKRLQLSVDMVHSEIASLEITAAGVNKGAGLLALCEYLGISPDETIAVGDADNDIAILQTAGLSIAMGNAEEYVKTLADVVVADCDHDGCAEAIFRYLL